MSDERWIHELLDAIELRNVNEQAEQSPAIWIRIKIRMAPGFRVPAGAKGPPVAIRQLLDGEITFEGFIWPTDDPEFFIVSKHPEDKPAEAVDEWRR